MTAVGNDNTWAWVDALPAELDGIKAEVYRQIVKDNVIQLGGEHYLFENGQVWWSKGGRWKRDVITPADLTSGSLFERVTA